MDALVVIGFVLIFASSVYLRRDTKTFSRALPARPLEGADARVAATGAAGDLHPRNLDARAVPAPAAPAGPPIIQRARPVSADRTLAAAARVAADEIIAAAREAQAEQQRQIDEAKEKLDRARELMQESGLLSAALGLFDQVRRWPQAAQDEAWVCPIPMANLCGGDDDVLGKGGRVEKRAWVSWVTDGVHYRAELIERGVSRLGLSDTATGVFLLIVDQSQVLELSISRNLGRGYNKWLADGVDALIVGPWMIAIATLSAQLRVSNAATVTSRKVEDLSHRAEQIDLGAVID